MGKVGTQKERIGGQLFILNINYSSKNKFTITGIPTEVYTVLGLSKPPSYETEIEAIRDTQKMIRTYHNAIAMVTKVICYEFVGSNHQVLVNVHGHSWLAEKLPGVPDNIRSTRFGEDHVTMFGLKYCVCEKLDANGTKWIEYNKDGSKKNTHSSAPGHELPWSEELELYFEKLRVSIDESLQDAARFVQNCLMLRLGYVESILTHTINKREEIESDDEA